jgi:1-acyl-sn-glycerol-3-phosphate acyltransferase
LPNLKTPILMVYLLKLAVIGVITVPAASATTIIGLFDPYGKRVYGIGRFWAWIVLRVSGVSLKVNGLSHIDPNRQYVFMSNHQSNLDIPVLIQSLPGFQLRWIAKKELLWIPFFGWAMWASKHIAVDRSARSGGMGILKKAQQSMAGGISLVVFPEGTRGTSGRLLPFKRGGLLLALKAKAPIVPLTINGSGELLPRGDWRIRRGEIQVTVGEPISVENYRPGTLRALSAEVHDAIAKNLSLEVRTSGNSSGGVQPVVATRV